MKKGLFDFPEKRRTKIKAYVLLENSEITEIESMHLPEIGDDVFGQKVIASGITRESMELIRGIMQEESPQDGASPEQETQEPRIINSPS